jgi:hypothetical protein
MQGVRHPVAAEAGRLLRLLFLWLGSLPANTSGATVLWFGKAVIMPPTMGAAIRRMTSEPVQGRMPEVSCRRSPIHNDPLTHRLVR